MCRSTPDDVDEGDDDDDEDDEDDEGDEDDDEDDEDDDDDDDDDDNESQEDEDDEIKAEREAAARLLHLQLLQNEAKNATTGSQLKTWFKTLKRKRHKANKARKRLRGFDFKHCGLHLRRGRLVARVERRAERVRQLEDSAMQAFYIRAAAR